MAIGSFYYAPPQSDFETWLATVRRAAAGGYTRDAILGGLRARLYTNLLAVAEAWSETFFGPQEWQVLLRQTLPLRPAMSLYAVEVPKQEPLVAVQPTLSTGVMLNRTDRDAVLDVVTALAAHEMSKQAAWVVRGTCAVAGNRAALVTGPGHAEVAAEIAAQAGGQVTAADSVLVRATLKRRADGAPLAPTRILTERGREITGARILPWLRREAYQELGAKVFCLRLDGGDEAVTARDLDLDRYVESYAFPLTRTGHKQAEPPLVTDAIVLKEKSETAVLSVDAKTFLGRLATEQVWTSQEVVREVTLAIQCHVAGSASPTDQRHQEFIAEIAQRLQETNR